MLRFIFALAVMFTLALSVDAAPRGKSGGSYGRGRSMVRGGYRPNKCGYRPNKCGRKKDCYRPSKCGRKGCYRPNYRR